jgi:hypothetical protein
VIQTILSAESHQRDSRRLKKHTLRAHNHHSITEDRSISFRGFDPYQHVRIMRRRLPHWRQSGVAYFVTFRLADSLPQSVLRQWRDERATWERWRRAPWSAEEQREYACHLRRSEVWAQVELCLLHFDAKRYDVDAFVLMPNDVHAVIVPQIGYDLSTLLQGIKGTSANRCSKTTRPQISFLNGRIVPSHYSRRERTGSLSSLRCGQPQKGRPQAGGILG